MSIGQLHENMWMNFLDLSMAPSSNITNMIQIKPPPNRPSKITLRWLHFFLCDKGFGHTWISRWLKNYIEGIHSYHVILTNHMILFVVANHMQWFDLVTPDSKDQAVGLPRQHHCLIIKYLLRACIHKVLSLKMICYIY